MRDDIERAIEGFARCAADPARFEVAEMYLRVALLRAGILTEDEHDRERPDLTRAEPA